MGRINPASKYAKDFPDQQPRDGQRIATLAALFKLVNDLGAKDVHFDAKPRWSRRRAGIALRFLVAPQAAGRRPWP